ncbi:hypothetical protein AB1M95_16365 [Sulfitobacter sp. LCG007]
MRNSGDQKALQRLKLELVFRGADADDKQLDFYDAAQALVGFERAVSLTTNLIVTGNIITQSPAAKGFTSYLLPPEEGSWKAGIGIFFGATLTMGVASKDSVLGYLAVSALDYVIQQSLGFEVDFERSLGPQIEDAWKNKVIPASPTVDRFDSVIEKIEPGLRSCHRPIVFSETAHNAQVNWRVGSRSGTLDGFFDHETYEYIARTIQSEDFQDFAGAVSSYNRNTYKGRIYIPHMQRTVPFELSETSREADAVRRIVGSLYENTSPDKLFPETIIFRALRNESVNGRLKGLFVIDVNPKGDTDIFG